jgi:hypothetical protein
MRPGGSPLGLWAREKRTQSGVAIPLNKEARGPKEIIRPARDNADIWGAVAHRF